MDIKKFDEYYYLMVFDADEIIGPDEIIEVRIAKRLVLPFLGISEEKFEKLLMNKDKRKLLTNIQKEIIIQTKFGFRRELKI